MPLVQTGSLAARWISAVASSLASPTSAALRVNSARALSRLASQGGFVDEGDRTAALDVEHGGARVGVAVGAAADGVRRLGDEEVRAEGGGDLRGVLVLGLGELVVGVGLVGARGDLDGGSAGDGNQREPGGAAGLAGLGGGGLGGARRPPWRAAGRTTGRHLELGGGDAIERGVAGDEEAVGLAADGAGGVEPQGGGGALLRGGPDQPRVDRGSRRASEAGRQRRRWQRRRGEAAKAGCSSGSSQR